SVVSGRQTAPGITRLPVSPSHSYVRRSAASVSSPSAGSAAASEDVNPAEIAMGMTLVARPACQGDLTSRRIRLKLSSRIAQRDSETRLEREESVGRAIFLVTAVA